METVGEIIREIVLDTNCLIQLEKNDESITQLLANVEIFSTTAISIFEFALGDSFKEEDNRLDDYNVMSFKKQDGLLTAKILKELKSKGQEIEFRDIMIGSICINRNLPFLTLNSKHFERLKEYGLKLVEHS